MRNDILKCILCVLMGGTAWYFLPGQIYYVGVEYAAGYRMVIAGLTLAAFAQLKGISRDTINRSTVGAIVAYGLLMFSLNYILCYSAAKYIATGLISLVVSAMIIPNMIFGRLILKTPITAKGIIGAAVCMAGLILTFSKDLKYLNFESHELTGALLCFSSIFLSALGTVIGGKIVRRGANVYWVTAIAMIIGGSLNCLIAYRVTGGIVWSFDAKFIMPLLYLSIFVTGLVSVVYLNIVSKYGAEKASYLWIFVPIVALNVSTLFEGLEWSVERLLGTVLVLTGGIIALSFKRKVPPLPPLDMVAPPRLSIK